MGGYLAKSVRNLTAEYLPAYSSSIAALHVKVTTAVNTAQRLGTLNATPQIPDDTITASTATGAGVVNRAPWHLIIQVPAAAANPVYITWDNNTAPVVGGPGFELSPGGTLKFENAGCALIQNPIPTGGAYPVNSLSAIQVIAVAATNLLLSYSD